MKNTAKRAAAPSIADEIANLTSRQETLNGRRSNAEARLDAAKSARRNALAGDPTADLANLNRDVRDVEDEIETLDSVLVDLTDQLRDAEARQSAAQDQSERDAAANTLEAIASTFDEGAAELEKALATVAGIMTRMHDALPETLHVVDVSDDRGMSEAGSLVSIVLADGLANAFPSAMPIEAWRRGNGHGAALDRFFDFGSDRVVRSTGAIATPALSASSAAAVLVSDRLRGRARQIRDGELGASLIDQQPSEPSAAPFVRPENVRFWPTAGFMFVENDKGGRKIVERQASTAIPEPVANAAVKAGLGLLLDTPEGTAAHNEAIHRRSLRAQTGMGLSLARTIAPEDCHDLGDPVGYLAFDQAA